MKVARTAMVAAVALASICAADEASGASTPRFGTLAGIVRTPGGMPVSGVCVLAQPVSTVPYPKPVTTDHNGKFAIPVDLLHISGDIGPQGYEVRFTLCSTRVDVAPEWWLHGDAVEESQNVIVRPGRTTTMKVALRPGADISGQVRLAPGVPLAGVCVATVNMDSTDVYAKTDSSGNYRLTQLVPGTHYVSVMSSCTNGLPLGAASEVPGLVNHGSGPHTLLLSTEVDLSVGAKATHIDFSATL